ncbi:restriction endonuclease subunit S [Pseudomonas sp. zjy_15]|uniref:restriction endonuclease subunit S n=1 Tax=Pseudomonas sp. zjy_15 TaxID=3367265 RepID=UPI00370B03CC
MSELPNNWTTARLGDLAEDISYGYTAPSTRERIGPHLLRITDIQDNEVVWSSVPYCEIDSEQAKKYLLKENDLVFARTGATVGKSFLITGEIPDAVFASYLIRVRCIRPEAACYLSLYFRSQDYWRQITGFSAGIGQPNVNGSKLKELVIPLPPLAEQTRIAAKLDELLAQVDTLKARIDGIPALLNRFRQSVLTAAVSGQLTEEWRQHAENKSTSSTAQLGALITEMRNGMSAKPNEDGKGLPILRISSVRAGSIDQTEIRFLECDNNERERYTLKVGDLLFTRYNGSLELVGVCGLVRQLSHRALIYPDKLIRVRCDTNLILPEYLELFFSETSTRHRVMDLVKSTSGQKGISGQDLKAMVVTYPSLLEQTEIASRVEQLFTIADQLEAKVVSAKSRIDHLTQGILAKAFRGELVPQNPNDEPASVLLERIKAQRAATPKAKRGHRSATLS